MAETDLLWSGTQPDGLQIMRCKDITQEAGAAQRYRERVLQTLITASARLDPNNWSTVVC